MKIFSVALLLCFLGCSNEEKSSDIKESNDPVLDPREITDPVLPPAGSLPLALHDVSVLFPIHKQGMLAVDAIGRGGPLIPKNVFTKVVGNASLKPENFFVVGMRLDPCAPALGFMETKPEVCLAQLRLIVQPLSRALPNVQRTASDKAIHAIYSLNRNELEELIQDISQYGDHSPEGLKLPLAVHPALAKEGEKGPVNLAIQSIILRYAGSENLTHASFFEVLQFASSLWDMRGFAIVNGEAVVQPVPNAQGSTVSTIVAGPREGGNVTPGGNPGPSIGHSISFIPKDVRGVKQIDAKDFELISNDKTLLEASPELFAEATQRLLDTEDPRVTFIPDMRCSICHVAEITRALGESIRPIKRHRENDSSASGLPLTQTSTCYKSPKVFRMFGYFDTDACVSQRTINESAAVVEALQKHGYLRSTRAPKVPVTTGIKE